MAPRAKVTSFTINGRRINVNTDLQNAGREYSNRVASGYFDAVREELGVRNLRRGTIIRQFGGGPIAAVVKRAAEKIQQGIESTGTYSALTSNSKLSRELGLTPTDRVNKTRAMLSFIRKSVVARYDATESASNASKQQVSFQLLVPSEETILANSFASFFYQGRGPTTRGQIVEIMWLDWLLRQGGTIVVPGHTAIPGEPSRSRQGTIMSSQFVEGRGWSVPVSHQGQVGSNFVTRGIERGLTGVSRDFGRQIRAAIENARRRQNR